MRCYICDSVLSSPVWNSQLKAYEPCPTCMDIIHHVFEDAPEQNSPDEESLEDVEDISDERSFGDSNPKPDEPLGKEGYA